MVGLLAVLLLFALLALFMLFRSVVVVPQQSAYVVERLGHFSGVLDAGFHILVPLVDVIRYRHTLKEQAIDIPEQVCTTRDDMQVAVDGVLSFRVLDAERASYQVNDYVSAIGQLAQTTLRSEVAKLARERLSEEKSRLAVQVATEVDKAAESWGVKVLRYEIKDVTPASRVMVGQESRFAPSARGAR